MEDFLTRFALLVCVFCVDFVGHSGDKMDAHLNSAEIDPLRLSSSFVAGGSC